MATPGFPILGMQLGGGGVIELVSKMKLYQVRELKTMHKSFNILGYGIYRILILGYLSLKYLLPPHQSSFLFIFIFSSYANFLKSLVAVIVMLSNLSLFGPDEQLNSWIIN